MNYIGSAPQPKHWMLALDGSDNADSAFNFAVGIMNRTDDHLLLVGVGLSLVVRFGSFHFLYSSLTRCENSYDAIQDTQQNLDEIRSMLERYEDRARRLHVKNVHFLVKMGESPGRELCDVIKKKKISCAVVGRRGMSKLKRLLLGSTSRYLVDNAICDVLVVKSYHGPEVIQDEAQSQKSAKDKDESLKRKRLIWMCSRYEPMYHPNYHHIDGSSLEIVARTRLE